MNILTVNLLLSTAVFWAAARIYVLPQLPQLSPRTVLVTHYLTFAVLTERTEKWAS